MPAPAAPPFYRRTTLFPTGRLTLAPEEVAPSLEDAYAAALELARTQDIGAWKLGGTNGATQALFGVSEPYYGGLAAGQVCKAGNVPPSLWPQLLDIQAEPEILLELACDITDASDLENTDLDDVGRLFKRWCWGLEFPNSPVTNMAETGVRALVADQCAAGLLLLGAPQHMETLAALDPQAPLAVLAHGSEISRGSIDTLTGDPAAVTRAFLALARRQGAPLKAGQWIATGGLAPCMKLAPGSDISLVFDGSPVLQCAIPHAGDSDAS